MPSNKKATKLTVNVPGLNEPFLETMRKFGEFVGAERVDYSDFGNFERLVLVKEGKQFTIEAQGNKVDGAYFVYKAEGLPAGVPLDQN
jgi:hypothetical protein